MQIEDDFYSEIPLLTRDVFIKAYIGDFSSDMEKAYYDRKMELVKAYIPEALKKIELEYTKYKIKRDELDFWKNPFKDEVYKVEENKFYIQENDYCLFWEKTEDGEYLFEVV